MSSPIVVSRERGFSVIEMLVATAIMVSVTGAIFSVMNPAHGIFAAQPEVSDMQQRMRIGVDTLYKDLVMAGAGTYSGAIVGTLGNYAASILPDTEGLQGDPPGTFKCTSPFCQSRGASDTITVMYVPPTSAQTTIKNPMPNQSGEIKVNKQAGCPSNDDLCGFKNGMTVLIFDDSGAYDTFQITNVQSDAIHLQHRGQALSKPYDSNAFIAQVAAFTYWLKTDAVAGTYQLMRYDGYQTDLPIAENVVGLAFEYFGDPAAPLLKKPVTDPKGPWTNYGPKPPALGTDIASDNWGPGENCLFMVSNGQQVARTEMPALGPANGALAKLTPAQLTNGPWCPDSANINRYDADLLRIRRVKVTLRVQVADPTLRGPTGPLFLRGGTSRGGEKFIPDQEITFDVAPRNLNFGR
jgi:hypothetical protein